MFETLQARLTAILGHLRGRSRLTEADIDAALREVRVALLEADVHFRTARDFITRVKERCLGADVFASLTPGQTVIKLVHEELVALMSGGDPVPELRPGERHIILMVGLQGSGKTTSCGKLAGYLRKQGRQPLLVAADVYRPAAIDQLVVLGRSLAVPVYAPGASISPVAIATGGVEQARKEGADTVIVDTAGRLHIDDRMMAEVAEVRAAVHPIWVLLVVDSMTGQDAVNQAKAFNEQVGIEAVVLTKLDSDTRGGAALSVRSVTGKPILFTGTGEKLTDFDRFYPDRMASRILGMGDVLTLVEKAQETFNAEQAVEMQKKLRSQSYTLEDFRDQIRQMRQLGSLGEIMNLLPGFGALKAKMGDVDMDQEEVQLRRVEAIICSMTADERRNPQVIGGSRRQRIARGSGTTPQDVNRLLRDFENSKKMLKQIVSTQSKAHKKRGLRLPFSG